MVFSFPTGAKPQDNQGLRTKAELRFPNLCLEGLEMWRRPKKADGNRMDRKSGVIGVIFPLLPHKCWYTYNSGMQDVMHALFGYDSLVNVVLWKGEAMYQRC